MKISKVFRSFKRLIPPLLWDWLVRSPFNHWRWWRTGYVTWAMALDASSGYDDHKILEKVSDAAKQVVSGTAAYERDSVLFPEIEYSWPLLAGVLYAAAKSGGSIDLIDFGGALGSTFYQNRKFLAGFPAARWHVIEQSHFADRGREQFANNNLRFNDTITEAFLENPSINTVIFSSVVQYLEDPFGILAEIFLHEVRFVIVDRTPFVLTMRDEIAVQKVPSWIYPASYPCRFFALAPFLDLFAANGYRLIEMFTANDGVLDEKHTWRGMIFERVE